MSEQCLVYWARPAHARQQHRRWFTDAERAREAAYRREIDAARFVVGCALSRLALGDLLSTRPADVPLLRDCADCGRPHGRPRLADDSAFVSVSHSGDHVVVAVTRVGPVGVDVERHAERSLGVAEAVLTDSEHATWRAIPESGRVAAFFSYWTRKEAALKATGHGLRVPMTSIEVSPPTATATVRSVAGTVGEDEIARLRLLDLAVDARHSAALAIAAGETPDVVRLDGARLLDD